MSNDRPQPTPEDSDRYWHMSEMQYAHATQANTGIQMTSAASARHWIRWFWVGRVSDG